jgi:hypothetical protein
VPQQVDSQVDFNKPVTNPVLREILRCKYEEPSKVSSAVLEAAIRSAVYLIPILSDEMKVEPSGPNGQMTLQKGSRIKVMLAFDQNKVEFLPLFTDREELKKWIRDPVSTLAMPARQAFGFVSASTTLQGVVINPAGQLLSIQRKGIELLAK